MSMIRKPFTDDQVRELNRYQTAGFFHPFTCGNAQCREILLATVEGWVCPKCDYTQNWAHEFMADKMANDNGEALIEAMTKHVAKNDGITKGKANV
jgi:hypothetical protein